MKSFLSAQSDWTPAIAAKGIEELQETLKKYGPKELANKCGFEEAAPFEEAAALLAQAQAPAIVFGVELMGQDKGEHTVMALADLFLLIGRSEAPGSGLYPVAEKANTRGVCEAGVLPDRLPGYLPLDDQAAAAFWGAQTVVKEPGLDLLAMLDKLEADDPEAPQALYALGGDLLRSFPNRSRTEKLLGKLKFIVVQDAFLNDFAQMADVVLPVAIHAEQEGTFISSAGSLGVLSQALGANGVKPDWQIINELGVKMGFLAAPGSPARIFQELAKNMPLWAGLAPEKSVAKTGIPANLSGQFAPFDLDISLPGRRPYTLIVGKVLQHSGSYTTHHPCGTLVVTPKGALALNPEDAASLELAEGDEAKIISSHGEITAPVTLDASLAPGVVFLPEHFAEPAAHMLTLNSNLVRVTLQKA